MARSARFAPLFISLALVVASIAIYARTLRHGFIYDDYQYVTPNSEVLNGVSAHATVWAFTTFYASNWHPLTWLSLQLDATLFGPGPFGFHLTNIALHAVNAVLVFLALRSLTGAVSRSAAVAALFAVHPLHVESVAWITERKDLLSTLFGMLALWAYARFAQKRSVIFYSLVAVLFALSLLAKPMLVTLPCLLLLLDWWPLQRTQGAASTRRLLLEKAPLFLLVGLSARMTFLAQRQGGAVASFDAIGLQERIANALIAYATYLWQTIWPTHLAAFYPHRNKDTSTAAALGSALLLLAITFFAVRLRRRHPYLLVGWLWFLGTLVPVIGLVQVGGQARADRYTYVPLIGLFIAASWGAAELFAARIRLLVPVSAAALVALASLSWVQAGYWENPVTLWTHALSVTRDNAGAACYLAVALRESGDLQGALNAVTESVRISPNNTTFLTLRGELLLQLGRVNDAFDSFNRALQLEPDHARAMTGMGVALEKQNRLVEAIDYHRRAIAQQPSFAMAYNNLGAALEKSGNYPEAYANYKEATRLDPYFALAQSNLATSLEKLGKIDEALAGYAWAISLDPDLTVARINRASLLDKLNRWKEAEEAFQDALRLSPTSATAHNAYGVALGKRGINKAALQHLGEAVRLDPHFAAAHFNFGLALESVGRGAEAQRQFQEAVDQEPKIVKYRLGLAASLRKNGNTAEATKQYQQILRIDPNWKLRTGRQAWVMATHPEPQFRDGQSALELAEELCFATDNHEPEALDVLAAAYAELGRFMEATASAKQALTLVPAGQDRLRSDIQARIDGYERKQPARDQTLLKRN